ncbi:1-deoxy-D-xylulose-5-phosphate reductoisomerase [Anaerotruncus sp. 80]|uniref:1-deoxy-D-xylulose 5-phosphate reductoisomerase n=1 Tax=Anaerotruncus colihominis TaxID=169435 RepID=A0A845QI89_9FIRM|nr:MULTISPECIES: 1-deoxy-D-xylulose-5-phosphate reductoisomerase [Anaerotruncus]NBH60493.1 1-deoxy-D-xylulose-5-phosphate reductoisomerase [Anaerotruncus colihominis]NCF01147.1 1-deoxy-D-xylulose-5-phosphate reductoisomerase [Anaerotruncus sp. 80]
MKKVTILGSTGSIGTQALDVIGRKREQFQIETLACGQNTELLEQQIQKFSPKQAVTELEQDACHLAKVYPKVDFLWGEKGLLAAAEDDSQILLNSLVGIRGLVPTYHAIQSGKEIALANKETLVAGGELIMKAVQEKGARMLPVDSEHSAIFQCLQGNQGKKIRKILLTASGGPFRGFSRQQLADVTLAQALHHPKWSMGKKITIDSATMMNKGLEVIEAKWLFDVPLSDIQILVHPQSIMHSAVEFEDGSVIAQMGSADMRIPISVALGYPQRIPDAGNRINFFEEGANLSFEEPDTEVFGCINLAYEASKAGGSYPVVLNAANEVMVDKFLKGQIAFLDIEKNIQKILDDHTPTYNLGLNEIINIDKEIRKEVL